MGPIWGRQGPVGPHVGPMNLANWVVTLVFYGGFWFLVVWSQLCWPDNVIQISRRDHSKYHGTWSWWTILQSQAIISGLNSFYYCIRMTPNLQTLCIASIMMTSSNRNNFRVTDHLCGDFNSRFSVNSRTQLNMLGHQSSNLFGCNSQDDVIKWKHFPRYWPFVRGIHRSPVNSPHTKASDAELWCFLWSVAE